MNNIKQKGKKRSIKNLLILLIFIGMMLLPIITTNFSPILDSTAHSSVAIPKEIASLWNTTSPFIDGSVGFVNGDLESEWSGAAIYRLFDHTNNSAAYMYIQNDASDLYLGLDLVTYQNEKPSGQISGCSIYIDRNHDGKVSAEDRVIRVHRNDSGDFVLYFDYNENEQKWQIKETGTLDTPLTTSNIFISDYFGSSYFESNSHQQYEMRIPLSYDIIPQAPGNITGFGIEAFNDLENNNEEVTWPVHSNSPDIFRQKASYWGDLLLGKDTAKSNYYADYIIEENLNIKENAIGPNNGTFIASGDITGDNTQELIVSSNRTVSGDSNLTAIYDYVNGNLQQIWNSWNSSYYSIFQTAKNIIAYDFTGDGKDEIYLCGETNRILRLADWNQVSEEFNDVQYVFNLTGANFMGYLALGDSTNSGNPQLVSGDDDGNVRILDYDSVNDEFTEQANSPYIPPSIGGNPVARIHSVAVGDSDSDGNNEILFFSQINSNNDLSTCQLQIIEYTLGFGFSDNSEDDLPASSSSATQDNFGHTILVTDVDNDSFNETILIGKNYLRIFGNNTFSTNAPIELTINDQVSEPKMGGGAICDDFFGDTQKEILFSCNNGTLIIAKIEDSGVDLLSYEKLWESDFGSSFGKRSQIAYFDIDEDTEKEISIGDTFGQILILGHSQAPELTITYPTNGSIVTTTQIVLSWQVYDDIGMHHYDVYINDTLDVKIGGGLTKIYLSISEGLTDISLRGYDITGKTATSNITFTCALIAPEVTIDNPLNGSKTTEDQITISYTSYDKDDNIDHYEIYRNGLRVIDSTTALSEEITLPSDQIYNITVKVVDEEGYTGRDQIIVIKDSTGPQITILSPRNNDAVNSTNVLVQWNAIDVFSNISRFDIYVNNIQQGTTEENEFEISLTTDKNYQVKIEGFDELDNIGEAIINIEKDSIKPNLTILSPQETITTDYGILTIIWDAYDNIEGTGINRTEVYLNQLLVYAGLANTTDVSFTEEGAQEIRVVTYDQAENKKEQYLLAIYDSMAPTIEIIHPVNNYNTSLDNITVYWNAFDSGAGVKEIQVFLDGSLIQTITNTCQTSTIISLSTEKQYTINIVAIDYLDNQADDTLIVNKNNSLPVIEIIAPSSYHYYSPSPIFELQWAINNIENITNFEIYQNSSLIWNSSNSAIRQQVIDLGVIGIDDYFHYNITILVKTNQTDYVDMIWVSVDQKKPYLAFISPANNNSIIYTSNLQVTWDNIDEGSGIQTTTIFLNTVERRTWDFAKKSHILSFDEGNGTYTIKVKAEDAAGNIEEKVLSVQVLTEELIFFSNLTDSFYTQSGNFYVTINVTNTGIGLRNINLYIDNMKIYSDNFSETIQNESLTNYQIEILNSEYNALNGPHNIILTFVDRNYNEFSQQREFFIDNQKPEIFGTITFGSQILSVATPIQIFLNIDPAKNNYTIRATAIDNLRVKSMILRIEGEDFTQEYIMIANTSSETIVDFYLDLNVINFETGDYQLNFITTDYAGNINSEVFNVTISSQTVLPWILQENNLLYVSAGSALTLVLIGFISFVLRKRLVNRGWQDAISAVAYVFNGIPCVYVQSDPNLMGDEMLFGGAMTGVKGVIEEITGEISEKMDIHSVEVGSKIVLICPGEHGDGILMVSDVKPIHKEKLQGFVDEFERTYHDILTDEEILIQDETFRGASIIIGTHFGVRTLMDVDSCSPSLEEDVTFETIKEEDITYPEEEIEEYQPEQEFMEESTKEPEKTAYEYPEKEQEIEIEEPESLEEIVNQLPKEEKNTFLSLLELTPMAITALLEYNLETAEESNTEIISKLETLLQSEKLSRRLSIVLQNILKVSQEIAKGIDAGRKDNQTILQEAAENASKIWLTSIGEDIQ